MALVYPRHKKRERHNSHPLIDTRVHHNFQHSLFPKALLIDKVALIPLFSQNDDHNHYKKTTTTKTSTSLYSHLYRHLSSLPGDLVLLQGQDHTNNSIKASIIRPASGQPHTNIQPKIPIPPNKQFSLPDDLGRYDDDDEKRLMTEEEPQTAEVFFFSLRVMISFFSVGAYRLVVFFLVPIPSYISLRPPKIIYIAASSVSLVNKSFLDQFILPDSKVCLNTVFMVEAACTL